MDYSLTEIAEELGFNVEYEFRGSNKIRILLSTHEGIRIVVNLGGQNKMRIVFSTHEEIYMAVGFASMLAEKMPRPPIDRQAYRRHFSSDASHRLNVNSRINFAYSGSPGWVNLATRYLPFANEEVFDRQELLDELIRALDARSERDG